MLILPANSVKGKLFPKRENVEAISTQIANRQS
jgi:hypothetical protein